MNADPLARLGEAARTVLVNYIPTLCKLPTEASTGPGPLLSRGSTSRRSLLPTSPPPRAFPHKLPNPLLAHLDRVQGVPHKHQAHAAKAAGQEVLKRTDGFRLLCHGQSSVSLLAAPGSLDLAPLSKRLHRPFTYIKVGGAVGRSERGPRRTSRASARSLLPAATPP